MYEPYVGLGCRLARLIKDTLQSECQINDILFDTKLMIMRTSTNIGSGERYVSVCGFSSGNVPFPRSDNCTCPLSIFSLLFLNVDATRNYWKFPAIFAEASEKASASDTLTLGQWEFLHSISYQYWCTHLYGITSVIMICMRRVIKNSLFFSFALKNQLKHAKTLFLLHAHGLSGILHLRVSGFKKISDIGSSMGDYLHSGESHIDD